MDEVVRKKSISQQMGSDLDVLLGDMESAISDVEV
jgi:hypothetical protein